LAHLDFLELRMPDNDRIIIARGNPAAELLAVGGFKILLGGDEDIGTRIKPQVLGSPLPYKVVGYDKHGFLAKPQPLAFLCGGDHFKGLSRTYLVGKERVAAVKDMGDGVDLVGS